MDLQSGSQVCNLLCSLLSMDSVDQLQPDLATPITPCFDRVFEPQRKRKCFLPGKARDGTVLLPQRALSTANIFLKLARRWRKSKRKCACKGLQCYVELAKDKDFLRNLARWNKGWIMPWASKVSMLCSFWALFLGSWVPFVQALLVCLL